MNERRRIIRIANWLAGMVSLIVTVLVPLGYYAVSYKYTAGSLESETEINSHIFSELINENPEFWQFEQMRLEELLMRRPAGGEQEIRRIVNSRNEVVAESADPISSRFTITKSYPLKDSGVTVGRLVISRSMVPIQIHTGLAACIGLSFGLIIFAAMKTLPFRAILKAEEALRLSEERFRLLLRNANDALYVHEVTPDGSGKFLEVNDKACEMLGYSREELLCMKALDIEIPGQRKNVPAILRDLDETGSSLFETEHVTKDGHRLPVEVSARLLKLHGRPVVLLLVRDTGERKRLEAERRKLQSQLNQAQKMESVGRLAGGVAHDYNNMLSVIIGYAEISLDAVQPGDPLHANLKEVLSAAHRTKAVTGQLLAFARKQTISPKVLDLNETIDSMLKMLRRLIGEDVDLAWLPEKDLWPVKMDPAQMDQILANLCVNARDAIGGLGKISISTDNVLIDDTFCGKNPGSKPGHYVMLAVGDDGCGMAKETLTNIFEPFFTTKGVGRGTGLGLSTVYGIVKQNDGYIRVDSEPGQGTVFRIYLPKVAECLKSQKVRPAAEIRKGKETILLVEDEPAILRLGKSVIESHGYTVLTAQSPEKALIIAAQHEHPIDLLITDVVMPQMNGKQLKEQIERQRPNVKVLFISGYPSDSVANRGILADDVQFLQKPFSNKSLVQKVQEILASRDDSAADIQGISSIG